MKRIGLLLVLVLLVSCKAKRGEEDKDTKSAAATPEVAGTAEEAPLRAIPRQIRAACPECNGTGLCPRCGDERPCLLCDGDGRCGLCGGTGSTRDGPCEACDGSGVCPACRGDGILSRAAGEIGPAGAPLPGQCPVCRLGTGLCPDCGGSGVRPDGEPCALCGGEGWCPDCRGAGTDTWCSGTGICPSCEGHGRIVHGRPGEGWPPARLILRSGEVVTGRILEPPDTTIAIERERGGRVVREAVVAKNVDPVSYVLALRRFLPGAEPARHLRLAEFGLRHAPELLFVALHELRSLERSGEGSGRVASLKADTETRIRAALRADAKSALGAEGNPRSAWALFVTAGRAFGGAEGDRSSKGASEALAVLLAEESGLSEEMRARKREAEASRLARAIRRATEWRARAESLLTRTGATVTVLLRARAAADRAREEVLVAADLSPESLDRSAALAEGRRDAAVAVRATVAVAGRLLEAGLAERARALAAVALALDPDDEGARRFAAAVDEAIARRDDTREEKR